MRLFDLVTQQPEQPRIVVDATDLRREPEHMMRSCCDAVGIPHVDEAMAWQSRKVEIWRTCADWHQAAEESTTISPPPQCGADQRLPAHLDAVIERCQPYYERLYAHRLGQ